MKIAKGREMRDGGAKGRGLLSPTVLSVRRNYDSAIVRKSRGDREREGRAAIIDCN